MKRFLLSLMAISLVAVGCFSFSQENDWIQYGEDEHGGTITVYSKDRSYGIVIQDKNVGATMTGYKYGATAATGSYGYHFQWGNNHGFSSDPNAIIPTTGTKVDASSYGPENPYLGEMFILGSASRSSGSDWSNVRNDNLRGGEGDDENDRYGLYSQNPIMGRQGPCDTGYHVPSLGEWMELVVIWTNNKYDENLDIEDFGGIFWDDETQMSLLFAEDMLIPFAGVLEDNTAENFGIGSLGYLWSSTPNTLEDSGEVPLGNNFLLENGSHGPYYFPIMIGIDYRASAQPVRCFKNERVYPGASNILTFSVTSGENVVSTGITFSDDEPLTSGQVLGAIEWLASEVELASGYHFAWYTDDGGVETGFDLDTAISEGTITSSIALTGKIEANKYMISFLDENGAEIMSGEFTYGQEANLPANTSAKEGYTFKGWNDSEGNTYDDGTSIKNLITEDGAVLEFTPIWEPNKYIISFLDENGAEIMSGEFTYDQEANLPANTSTKEGYTFKGWKDAQGNTYEDGATVKNLTTENGAILQFTPIWEKQESKPSGGSSGGGGSRGGGSNTTDSQTDNNKTTDSEKSDETPNNNSESDDDNMDGLEVINYNPDLPAEQQTLSDGLTPEMHQAYKWAYKNGITTMPTILEADMYGPLDRISMAKMLSTYAIKILGMTPDTERVNQFADVTPELDAEFNNGVTLAYQLGIMGINMYNNEFRPFDLVPRSEFGTALSRMLYQLSDGVYEKTDEFYVPHFNKLSAEGIMTVLDPAIEELRGYVMIMLMRSAKKIN